jgi:F420H(2)-dependent quinone reductase
MINWKYFGRVHKLLYKITGGKFGARMGWIDVALIETVGHKSGKLRTVPLACYPYRDSVAVSASNSGLESHPAWYLNIQANPEVSVQLGKERFRALAQDVPADEREALWAAVVRINRHQGEYLDKVEREIPLVWFRRLHNS